MAQVTPEGIEPTSLQGYVDALGTAFRTALGEDLDLAPETPQGQIVGALALTLTQVDEALIGVSNGQSVSRALGIQLDDLGSLLGMERLLGTRSTVTATLAGQSGVSIPAGSRARTTVGDLFELAQQVTVPDSGSASAAMRSVAEGPVPAAVGTLTQIVDLVVGWESATNPEAAVLGRGVETDEEYRARYGRVVARNARGSAEAILAAVLGVEGVTDALVRENAATSEVTVQGKAIAAHSVCVVVEGGTDADIAAAIARTKPGGTGTSGDTMVNVPHRGGWSVPIRLSRVVPVPIKIKLALTLQAGFPSDGTGRIVTQVLDHVNRLTLGQYLTAQRLLADVLLVPGHTVDLGVGRKGGTVLRGTGTVADLVNFHGRATVVTGTGPVASLTTLQGITSGSVTFLSQTVTGLDFSSDTDLDGVASTLQTALRATSSTDLDNVEVAYDSTAAAFVVTIPLDSSGAATSVSAAFTGTESDELGLDTATIVDGVDTIRSGTITLHGATASGLDFGAVASYDDVATVVEGALRGASETDLDQVEVAYVDGAFVITVPLDEGGNPVTVTGALTGDTADELGLDTVGTVQGSVASQDYIELIERLTVIPEDITITVLAS